jgi:aminoglycoside 3-N-acetyltransferase
MKNKIENNFQNEILNALNKLKLKRVKNIYITSNLKNIGRIELLKKKKLDIIFKSLKKIMGNNYSIFSPAASMNLCNTSEIFDQKNTPSHKMGPLAEYLRKKKNSYRSLHPFWSISCIGKNKNLLKNVSSHAYGAGSAWSVMLELDTMQVNIGINPEHAVTLVHHVETVVGVPYRYNKEFYHPIKIKSKIFKKKFYLSVRFKKYEIKKRLFLNKHFFDRMKKNKKLNYYKNLNGLEIWTFKMRDFYNVALSFFIKDIYTYLEKPMDIDLDI